MRRAILGGAAAGIVFLLGACARNDAGPGRPGANAEADRAALAALVPPYDDQLAHYTVGRCLVCGMALRPAGGPVDFVQDGKLVRVCSTACRAKVQESPANFIAARDSALIATQLASYPTDACIVTEDKIESLGTPTNILYGTRLVRLCCKTCEQQFLETPGDFIAALDAMGDVKAVEAGRGPAAN